MESTSITLGVLSDLLKINGDRVEGYKRASHDTDDQNLKALFSTMADQSQQNITDITREIKEHNGRSEPTETTYVGKIYQAWDVFKTKFSNKSIKNILISCESREEAAEHIYQQAKKKSFNTQLANLIESQALSLKSAHEIIRAHRQAYSRVDELRS